MRRTHDQVFALPVLALLLGSAQVWGAVRPRPAVIKPQHVQLEAYHRTDVIRVKFHDDAPAPLDEVRAALPALAEARWRPLVDLPAQRLQALRQNAQQNLGRALADFRVWFHVFLPEGIDATEAIDALNDMESVELAEPVQEAAPAPAPPPYGGLQRYLNAGPVGLGAYAAWEQLGLTGSTATPIVDIEFGYDFHQDLPAINQIGPPGDPAAQSDRDHGTAVLGVLASQHNGYGTNGIAPDAWIGFAAVKTAGVVNIPQAIVNATDLTGISGTIILIEQQIAGPASCGNPCAPLGLPPCDCSAGTAWVPVEWDLATYNAILYAVGNGKTVIEPAGNGAQDLDDPIYSTGNNGHWPFLAQNDSGAVMVGAGRGWDFIDTLGSRICCSNYGSRVDVSGYGTAVYTTGYGNLYSAEGPSLNYTHTFAGTSSASACVAGAAALVQEAYYLANSGPGGQVWMSPGALRQALVDSGTPQTAATVFPFFPASQNIGPKPDASIAILLTAGGCIPLFDTAIGNPGTNDQIDDLEVFDDGNGDKLYAGGGFWMAGGVSAQQVAAWDGTNWSAVGSGPGFYVYDLAVFDDGNGAKLYAAGGSGVARWNGSTWTAVGGSFDSAVFALEAFNGSLYAAGFFTNVNGGGTPANRIARWNGSSWSALGSGLDAVVNDMAVYNSGTGVALYVGGEFHNAGGTATEGVARWNGSSWSAVGSLWSPPLSYIVHSLEVFHDGNALELYAGGYFFGNNSIRHVARFNGSQWSPVGSPLTNGTFDAVHAMKVFDDGTGPALFMGGAFEQAEDAWVNRVVKWDGSRYWPLGDGVGEWISSLAAYDDGNGPDLYVGGGFSLAYDLPVSNIVNYGGCPPTPCPGDIDGNRSVGVTDLLALLAAWGPNPGHPADLDGDGSVGVTDLLIVLAQWGSVC